MSTARRSSTTTAGSARTSNPARASPRSRCSSASNQCGLLPASWARPSSAYDSASTRNGPLPRKRQRPRRTGRAATIRSLKPERLTPHRRAARHRRRHRRCHRPSRVRRQQRRQHHAVPGRCRGDPGPQRPGATRYATQCGDQSRHPHHVRRHVAQRALASTAAASSVASRTSRSARSSSPTSDQFHADIVATAHLRCLDDKTSDKAVVTGTTQVAGQIEMRPRDPRAHRVRCAPGRASCARRSAASDQLSSPPTTRVGGPPSRPRQGRCRSCGTSPTSTTPAPAESGPRSSRTAHSSERTPSRHPASHTQMSRQGWR